ncbi:MAG: hypothetical protein ACK46Q_03325 [Hyphomonas sp.]
MTRHFNVSEVDCLEIAGSAHRLIRSDKTGSIWARLDDDNIRLSFTGEELLGLLAAPDTRLKRGHFSDQSAFRRLRCDHRYIQTLPPEQRSRILWQTTCARFFLEAEARGDTTRSEGSVEDILEELERHVNAAERSGQEVSLTPRAGQGYINRKFPLCAHIAGMGAHVREGWPKPACLSAQTSAQPVLPKTDGRSGNSAGGMCFRLSGPERALSTGHRESRR